MSMQTVGGYKFEVKPGNYPFARNYALLIISRTSQASVNYILGKALACSNLAINNDEREALKKLASDTKATLPAFDAARYPNVTPPSKVAPSVEPPSTTPPSVTIPAPATPRPAKVPLYSNEQWRMF